MFSWAYILAKQHILLTYSMGNGKCLEISSVECDFWPKWFLFLWSSTSVVSKVINAKYSVNWKGVILAVICCFFDRLVYASFFFLNNINIACWWEPCSANHSVWRSPISKTQQLASPIGQAPSYWAAWHTQFFLSIRQYQYKLSFYNDVSTPNNNDWNIFILFDS